MADPLSRPTPKFLAKVSRDQVALMAAQPRTFRRYAARWLRQFFENIKDNFRDTLIALLAVVGVLAIQFKAGLIQTDQTWSSVAVNLGPTFFVLTAYVVYHGLRTSHTLDSARAADTDVLLLGLEEAETELQIERTEPKLEGRIHQVYFDSPEMPLGASWIDGGEMEISIQVSLGNVRQTETAIHEFRLRVETESRVYEGSEVSMTDIAYSEVNSFDLPIAEYFIDRFEVAKNPLPNGYSRGHMEPERWLRFRITGIPVAEIDVEERVRQITLLATDIFEITHEVSAVPPWRNRGRVFRHG